mmetsp:Transcript_18342/g.28621  ORF Transcript_18342/g.28621 Transcript_18342/m.28621 type:complete len:182 (+) Transcript_18342:583-1128(+)
MWAQRARKLKRYWEKNRHCNVPQKEKPLGMWVLSQRIYYKKWKEGKTDSWITPERVKILNLMGFEWDASHRIGGRKKNDRGWMQRLEELKKYKEEHGDCLVPQRYESNPQLGNWVNEQRTQYRNMQQGKPSRLDLERVQQLEAVDFVWQLRKRRPRKRPAAALVQSPSLREASIVEVEEEV